MKYCLFKKLILVGLLFYIPFQSMAWGLLGHRVVGQIAETYLNRKTKNEIKKILGNESLAMTSNWADFIKSEPSYNYLNNWHYVNLPAGLKPDQLNHTLAQDTATNIYTRINFLSAELKNKALEQDKKVMYLKLLIHFVGDIHQPMHTGRFEDLGGNKIQLTWFGQNTNLHRIWDSDLIEYQQLSYTEYARSINFIGKNELHNLQSQNVAHWVVDSYKISENLYANVKSGDKLGYRYIYDNIETANRQLLKGGVHLAAILNNIFSK